MLVMVVSSCSNVAPTEPTIETETLYDEEINVLASVTVNGSSMEISLTVKNNQNNRLENLHCEFNGIEMYEPEPGKYNVSVCGNFIEGQRLPFSIEYDEQDIVFEAEIIQKPVLLSPTVGMTVKKGNYILFRWNKLKDIVSGAIIMAPAPYNIYYTELYGYMGSQSSVTNYIGTELKNIGDYNAVAINISSFEIKRNGKICGKTDVIVWSDPVMIQIVE